MSIVLKVILFSGLFILAGLYTYYFLVPFEPFSSFLAPAGVLFYLYYKGAL